LSNLIDHFDDAEWDRFVIEAANGHIMQSAAWGHFKTAVGWQTHRLGVVRQNNLIVGAQILFRRLPFLPASIAYIPKGPFGRVMDTAALEVLFAGIHQLAHRRRAIFLKIEPNWPDEPSYRDVLLRQGFLASEQTNQPRSTITIDLRAGEQALWGDMRKKTRKLVRRAGREGVTVVDGSSADMERFFAVLRTTAKLKGFAIHNLDFYTRVWHVFQRGGQVHLLLAIYRGDVVGGKMIFTFKDTTMHFWGGTVPAGRKVFASYLLQWRAIQWALEHGFHTCDLWGIPNEVGNLLKRGETPAYQRTDGLWGVYTFKRGFGGQVETYSGAYDYPYRPTLYKLGTKIAKNQALDTLSTWVEKISSIGA